MAFLIGEAGVLIGSLDDIAGVVSMVFLTLYGFLNICCAIESWVSPDFRPAFSFPKLSVVGAVTCIVIMIQLDLVAMAASILILGLIFLYLSRRQFRYMQW